MRSPSVLILGIGNILWADEGFGVRALESLQRHYHLPDNVVTMDGGTQGLYLTNYVCEAEVLIVFDAVDYGLPPATVKVVEDDDVPAFLGAKKISLHQTGFQEVLATAEMLGHRPQHMLLIGVQPEELEDYGGSLRPAVRDRIPEAIDHALTYLARFDIHLEKRTQPLDADVQRQGTISDIQRYEAERPSEQAALRTGDARVVQDENFTIAYRPVEVDQEFIPVGLDHHLDKYR